MVSKPGLVLRESIPIENRHEYIGGHLNFPFGSGIIINVAQIRRGGWDMNKIGRDRR